MSKKAIVPRDLDHIMGSRFKERTGLDKKYITEREYQKMKKDKENKRKDK